MDTQKIGSPKLPQVQKSLLEPGTEEVIPEGYCQCGCGGKTKLAPQTNRKLGWVRGEPIKFIVGHWANLGFKGKKPHNYNGGIAKTGKNKGNEIESRYFELPRIQTIADTRWIFNCVAFTEIGWNTAIPTLVRDQKRLFD